MPDVACVYTLKGSGGTPTLVFNDGSADQFYITEIPTGLAGPPLTTPRDPVPFSAGSLSYAVLARGCQIQIEGIFLITSTRVMNNILTIRNEMEKDLRDLLNVCTGGPGSLTFQPLGQAAVSCNVWYASPLECVHDQGYLVRTFTFGLFCDDAFLYS